MSPLAAAAAASSTVAGAGTAALARDIQLQQQQQQQTNLRKTCKFDIILSITLFIPDVYKQSYMSERMIYEYNTP